MLYDSSYPLSLTSEIFSASTKYSANYMKKRLAMHCYKPTYTTPAASPTKQKPYKPPRKRARK